MWAPLTPQNNPSWYHHYLRFTDRQSENQSWEVTCSVSGNDYGFLRLISILYSFYSGSFISSFDSLMRGVNRLHLITSTFCQLWLLPVFTLLSTPRVDLYDYVQWAPVISSVIFPRSRSWDGNLNRHDITRECFQEKPAREWGKQLENGKELQKNVISGKI